MSPALVLGIEAAQVRTERQTAINKWDAPECVAVRAVLAGAALTAASDIFGITHFPAGASLKLFRCKHVYFLSGAVPLWPVGLRGVVLFFMISLYMGKPHISIVNSHKSKPHILYNIYGVNPLLFCARLAYNIRCQEDSTKPPDHGKRCRPAECLTPQNSDPEKLRAAEQKNGGLRNGKSQNHFKMRALRERV